MRPCAANATEPVEVLDGRGHLDRCSLLVQVGLDGQQCPAGMSYEVADGPLAQPKLVPFAVHFNAGAHEPGRGLREGLPGAGLGLGRHKRALRNQAWFGPRL